MPFDNILDFVESPQGLNWTLLPVQRFILKLHYGIELDAHDGRIPIYDTLQERHRYTLTEFDYLNYLYGEGRCSVSDQSSLPRPGLVLAMGRRTGKTVLAELIACYTVIQMLQMGNPHEVFGFSSARPRIVASCYVGLNRESVANFLSGVAHNVSRCGDLRLALASILTQSARELRFTTPEGRALGIDRGNLSILGLTSRPSVRGSSCTSLTLDELAYMPNEQDILDSSLPSILPSGRYVLMSTPRRAEGAFYNHFRHAMGNGPEAPLALQIPTWEVQPSMSPFLRQRFDENPTHYYIEYGARWHHPQREVRIELRV